MTPSRILLAGVAAAMLVPTIASAACVRPAEKAAFDIRALQSQLMVAALSCAQQDDYNTFVRKFQTELGTAFRGVAGHFRRTAGSQHQRQLDQYITQLANGQSQLSIARGSFFCREQTPLFQAALAAGTSAELSQLSVQRAVHQELTTPMCPAATTPAARTQQVRSQQQQRPQGQQQPRPAPARTAQSPAATATR